MTVRTARLSDQHRTLIVAATFLFALVLAYIALCLVVLHRPEWLPSSSIFYASLIGPPHWLVWGSGARSMFWGSTLAIVAVAAVGATFRPLMLLSAGLCFLIWLGAGFLSVAMSI